MQYDRTFGAALFLYHTIYGNNGADNVKWDFVDKAC